jgi:hypothetical protein
MNSPEALDRQRAVNPLQVVTCFPPHFLNIVLL